jgi:hypothetical protein
LHVYWWKEEPPMKRALAAIATSVAIAALLCCVPGELFLAGEDGGGAHPDAAKDAHVADRPETADASHGDGATSLDGGGSGDAPSSGDGAPGDAGKKRDAASTLTYFCPGMSASVSTCALCLADNIGCVYCMGSSLAGTCIQLGMACQGVNPPEYNVCPCTTSADCPVGDQVCLGGGMGCGTCGSMGSMGRMCKSGALCNDPGECM